MPKTVIKWDLFQKPLCHTLLIITICLLAYSNTFNVPFHFDDKPVIVENPIIKNLGFMTKPSKAKDYKKHFEYDTFKRRYIGYLTFALNYWVHSLDVRGFHLVNLFIHIMNALFVYMLVALTFKTPFFKLSSFRYNPNHIALLVGLLFVCHPIQTQAVTYIWQRVTSLATTFYCFSLLMYVKWRVTAIKTNTPFLPRALMYYVISLFSAVLAMKTKEIAFTLPVVISLYELLFFQGNLKSRLLHLVPFLLTLFIVPISILQIDKPIGEIIDDVSKTTRGVTDVSRWDYLFTLTLHKI